MGDLLFPRNDTSTHTSNRQIFADFLSENIFFAPLRKTLSELVEIPELPLYVYMFDYHMFSRSESFPEKELRTHYGKFHWLDSLFVMGNFGEAYKEKLNL